MQPSQQNGLDLPAARFFDILFFIVPIAFEDTDRQAGSVSFQPRRHE
jgi:hypothetical protein